MSLSFGCVDCMLLSEKRNDENRDANEYTHALCHGEDDGISSTCRDKTGSKTRFSHNSMSGSISHIQPGCG